MYKCFFMSVPEFTFLIWLAYELANVNTILDLAYICLSLIEVGMFTVAYKQELKACSERKFWALGSSVCTVLFAVQTDTYFVRRHSLTARPSTCDFTKDWGKAMQWNGNWKQKTGI